MICVSLQKKNLEELFAVLERPEVEMAEIRLDLCPLSEDDISELFSLCDKPLVATCRIGELSGQCEREKGEEKGRSSEEGADWKQGGWKREGGEREEGVEKERLREGEREGDGDGEEKRRVWEAERRLVAAMEAGAKYCDLELEAPAPVGKRLRRKAAECGTIFIRSYHNFEYTPSAEELHGIVAQCRRFGAEVVKIAVKANSPQDVTAVESLYGSYPEGSLLAFCMGEAGKASRLDCLRLGAPFSFAALGDKTAEGQYQLDEMRAEVYGGYQPYHRTGIEVPASKSMAQRAIIAAALADGTSHLSGYTPCEDSQSAIAAARALGAEITEGTTLVIRGCGPAPLSLDRLDVGESGLLTRMLIPVLAMKNGGKSFEVTGRGTLPTRPLAGAAQIMASFGVMLENLASEGKEIKVPLRVNGKLLPGRADISGKGGSQLISGLLMALPMADKNSTLSIHEPKSIPYMFMTADVLQKFGIKAASELEGGDDFLESQDWSLCTGMTFRIKGEQKYQAADFRLEADWSSAAPFLVAGAIFGSAQVEGLDTSSLQADLSIIDILAEAGACVSQVEDSKTVCVQKAPLNAFEMDLANAPDLFPVVSVLAAFCPGQTRLGGVGRLATKESNRAEAILEMLRQMGVDVSIEKDDMLITGHSLTSRLMSGNLLRSGAFTSRHDHRMVMALKVAQLGADGPIQIDDELCVAKSFPDFHL